MSTELQQHSRSRLGKSLVQGLALPLNQLSFLIRSLVVVTCSVAVLFYGFVRNGDLSGAWSLPDVLFYLDMAAGRVDRVPQPFNQRPLAPLLARTFQHWTHGNLTSGFAALAYLSVAVAALGVFWLLVQSSAPAWTALLLLPVPFWPQLLGNAGLPDPLYTALVMLLLVALQKQWFYAAAVLMLPLMLTRESTTLTLACLLVVGVRQMRWWHSLAAVSSGLLGMWFVHRWSARGLPNPEHLSAGVYLFGKLVSNFLRSLGVVPWSNVYPFLCSVPAWQVPLHLGGIRQVGICTSNWIAPLLATWAFVSTFGIWISLCFAGIAVLLHRGTAKELWRSSLLLRFCVLYGGLSLILAPALGTWYSRLVGYAWPLLLVAGPRILGSEGLATRPFLRWVLLLALELSASMIGWRVSTPGGLGLLILLQIAAAGLLLSKSRSFRATPAPGGSTVAW